MLLNNHVKEYQLFSVRAHWALAITLFCMILLIVRLIQLQVLEHKAYTTLSNQNHITLLPIPPKRGIIYDRHGTVLATNRPAFTAVLYREASKDLPYTISTLQKVLMLPPEELTLLKQRIKNTRSYEPVVIQTQLTEEDVARLTLARPDLPGVKIEADLVRHYPHKEALAHVLGYVSRISEDDLTRIDSANYAGTNVIGKTGIERSYESELHGKTGYKQVEIDANGRVVRTLREIEPEPGADLYLSLDLPLQLAAMESLTEQRGAVVAISPKDGGILALASAPSFDPNAFVRGISTTEFHALQNAPDRPLFNRAIKGQYPPASTVKPIFALAGLNLGTITPQTRIFDTGKFYLAGVSRPFRDWRPHGHGWTDLNRALYGSCDIYFYQLAQKLGINVLHDWLSHFGIGEATGVDIIGESIGIAPSPAWKKQQLKANWFAGETIHTGIGQGYTLTTPLQLAVVASTFATRGKRMQAHFAERIHFFDGTDKNIVPVSMGSVEATPDNWQQVIAGMHNVVAHAEGTAHYLHSKLHIPIAGKTGTAQVFSLGEKEKYDAKKLTEKLRDHTLFIGFAPIENPEIAISVILENSKGSPNVAATILNRYRELYP